MGFFPTPTSYDTLAALLAATRGPGRGTRRKLANNTYAVRVSPGAIAVRLHTTNILTHHDTGAVVYDTGGWYTYTTKDRMNTYGPLRVWSDGGVWYASTYAADHEPAVYADGMTASPSPDGYGWVVTGAGTHDDTTRARATRRAIRAYAALYASADRSALADAAGGDCFLCRETTTGAMLGDAVGDHEHLREHIREGYVMAHLLIAALRECGYREPAAMFWHGTGDSVRRAVARFLVARLTTTTGAHPTGARVGV